MGEQLIMTGYDDFVEKFKPKKTTDDCYTPPEIYEVIKQYACERWNIDPDKVVRPFWPGGDFESFDYSGGAVVIDNPPFSILSKIEKFYIQDHIPFFLFAPSLTALGGNVWGTDHIICDCDIVYANGADVKTSFVTSLGWPTLLESAPELTELVNRKMKELSAKDKKSLPKYSYPDEIVTCAMVQKYSRYGVHFSVNSDECYFIRTLDAQRSAGKAIFGGGLLLSQKAAAEKAAAEKAAAEKAAAEKAAAEKAAATVWELSLREKAIVEALSTKEIRMEGFT